VKTLIGNRLGLITALAVLVSALAGVLAAAPALAAFGIQEVKAELSAEPGVAATQAGSHPLEGTVFFQLNTTTSGGAVVPEGDVKTAINDLPPGLIGNPQATPRCAAAAFEVGAEAGECPDDTQVGVAEVTFTSFSPSVQYFRIYNLNPPSGEPARFGARLEGAGPSAVLTLDAGLRSGEGPGDEYGLTLTSADIQSNVPVQNVSVSLWGVPTASVHDQSRGHCLNRETGPGNAEGLECPLVGKTAEQPFITLPTQCTEEPLQTTLSLDSWEQPGAFLSSTFPYAVGETPTVIEGCEKLPFDPSLSAVPTTVEADAPTGLAVDVHVPQNQEPKGLAESDLRRATVTLPEGMTVNPASANGLGACAAAQIELAGANQGAPASCPDNAKIGTVEIDTPLLKEPLPGSIYLARQGENKFGSLLAIYIAVNDPQTGIVIKLPGQIAASASGRLTATFDNTPQLPFEDLHATFFGGPEAALMTPPACGKYAIEGEFTPWSGTGAVRSTDTFAIETGPGGSACPAGSFNPGFNAGTVNPIAGKYSPFVFDLSRGDGSQRLGSITATLPPGLLGKLAGIPYCSDAALAGISGAEGTGAAQLATPSCPAASQVGTDSVGAGAGPSPFYVNTGKAYLAGPYKGAPLSLAIVTPALAGPFDLGTVVVRTALEVNPTTTQITAVSDPLPTILHGIPLDLRDVHVALDRSQFTVNPTSCEPMAVTSTITSIAGATAAPSSRFQVADCANLGFAPKLALSLKGGTTRAKNPALKAVLTAAKGQANIGKVQVVLPESEFIDNRHINNPCTRVQFNAGAGSGTQCPAKSVLGRATAYSPLLAKPLKGKIYFRSNGGKRELPDLVASLNGQIHVNLVGFIDSVRKKGSEISRTRNTFAAVPDAPVSRFVFELDGGKKGLLQNSTNLCKSTNRATVKMTGQNGKTHDSRPVVKVSCGGGKPTKK
jgi:hypothetical protein